MADKMRLTAHNGRVGKHGTYSAKHNDRNFDVRLTDHIDEDRSKYNWYWHVYQKDSPDMTFEDAEALYYERHFKETLNERNERSIKARHPERVKTMDDYRKSQKSCPEEQIMQIGKDGLTVDPAILQKIAIEQINWEIKQYPNFRLLDVALHVDEQGAPHIHKRGVWVAHEDGREFVGQAKALAEMGIEAPDPTKKYGKYNNAKMTHTKECREHLAEVCREHGLDLELTPKEHSKSGLALEEYKAQQEQEKARQAQQELEQAQEQIRLQQEELTRITSEFARITDEMEQTQEKTAKAQKALKMAQNALEGIEDKRQEFEVIDKQIATATKQLEKVLDMKTRAAIIKQPGLFNKGELVTYHKNTLESVEAIGREAKEYMEDAWSKQSQLVKREQTVEDKEKQINPLYEAAAKDRAQAKEYMEHEESYILGTAENKAQEMFDRFLDDEFDNRLKGKANRLERFCDKIRLQDGRTVLDVFKEQEEARQQELNRLWEDRER